MPGMEDDFSTIEHDFLHTKDYFSNYKFTYKERKSKLDFYQNIHSASAQDTTGMLEAAKAQLVEVKQQYKDLDEEICMLSQEIYTTELRVAQKQAELDTLIQDEHVLAQECANFKLLDEKLQINDSLNAELDAIESEIKECYSEIDKASRAADESSTKAKQIEEAELKMCKQDLLAKQKRFTVISTDNYIEDIYAWHCQMQEFLRAIFGHIDVQLTDGRLICHISANGTQIELTIEDKKFIQASISGNPSPEFLQRFSESKELSIKANNIMLLIAQTFMYFK